MKHLLSILILLGITSVVYSDTKELPEGTKLYCKEVHFADKERANSNIRERVGSNIRKLFIISDDKIYEIEHYSNFEYEIISKTEYSTRATSLLSESYTLTYFHETESISQGFAYDSSIASYQYNCSKIKNSIY